MDIDEGVIWCAHGHTGGRGGWGSSGVPWTYMGVIYGVHGHTVGSLYYTSTVLVQVSQLQYNYCWSGCHETPVKLLQL
jgi:hypothetical protein